MYKFHLSCALAIGLALSAKGGLVQIGTGLNASGNLLAVGATEVNYSVSGDAPSATVVSPQGNYVANTAEGQWIAPLNNPVGVTDYTLTLGAGSISGEFSSDNPGELLVNGVVITQTSGWPSSDTAAYESWWNFSAVLSQNVNTVEFEVNNLGGPAGLIVNGTFSAVPEPSTIMAGALMLLPLGAGLLRKVRK